MEKSYDQRRAEWIAANSIENRPLTDELRAGYATHLETGRIRIVQGPEGATCIERRYGVVNGESLYSPIDLEAGVMRADGEMNVVDVLLAPNYVQWLREIATEPSSDREVHLPEQPTIVQQRQERAPQQLGGFKNKRRMLSKRK